MKTEELLKNNDIQENTNNYRTRAEQLQFLRFIAFTFIFLWHSNIWNLKFMAGGNGAAWAVSFFFILSGFVTGYSTYKKSVKLNIKEIGKDMLKKIKKFYPLYFSMVVISIMSSKIPSNIAFHNFQELGIELLQLAKNLLLIQSWFPKGYFSYCGVGWFLSSIMFLYIFNIPFKWLLNKIEKVKLHDIIYFIMFVVILMAIILYSYSVRNLDMEFWDYILPISRLGEYLCGMIAGIVINSLTKIIKNNKLITILFTILELGTFILCYYCIYKYKAPVWQFRIVRWLLPNFMLICVFGIGKGYFSKLFNCKVLVALGNISFECYLLHQIIINTYMKLSGVGNVTKLGNIFSICFCLLITVSIAYMIHRKKENMQNLQKTIIK